MNLVSVILQLIFLEGVLSLDNAAVLGAMASRLPDDRPVPLPDFWHFLQPLTDKLLGRQETAVLRIGLLFAYLGRGLLLFAAETIRQNVVLTSLGAAYLIWLGLRNLWSSSSDSEKGVPLAAKSLTSFWWMVLQVELIDLVFSLDNVVAAVSLSPNFWVVALGVAVGIILMRFAAGVFAHLVKKEPVLETAAYLIIVALGAELLLTDFTNFTLAAW
ncbi:MAG: DUF475 domain-containing protein, partial [Anaerolineales bacterium]|nr:DUF475 domain-containing protein [Anaerolineales bacterium]